MIITDALILMQICTIITTVICAIGWYIERVDNEHHKKLVLKYKEILKEVKHLI